MNEAWKKVDLHEQAELLKKEQYVYRIEGVEYAIDLFATQQGKFYAVGLPSDSAQIIVYGSAIVDDAEVALHQAIQKINRDHFQIEIQSVGEDVRHVDDRND